MKTLVFICLSFIPGLVFAQAIRDTAFNVKSLFHVKLSNRDRDNMIKDDYILVELENLTNEDQYFYNISAETRESLPRFEKDNAVYILFGSIIPENMDGTIELYKLQAHAKIMCLYIQPNEEKGLIINYIDNAAWVSTLKKKYFIKSSDYRIHMLTERILLTK
ncbi:MAG: hypothetical protein JST26_00870 [Bacteroidetes bacterium]|nr:hypothetical protein [Bacteroidota bacterium]